MLFLAHCLAVDDWEEESNLATIDLVKFFDFFF